MIGAPPLLAGAFQVTLAEALPAVATTLVGAPGGVAPPPPEGVVVSVTL